MQVDLKWNIPLRVWDSTPANHRERPYLQTEKTWNNLPSSGWPTKIQCFGLLIQEVTEEFRHHNNYTF